MVKPATFRWLRSLIASFALPLIGLPVVAQEAPRPPADSPGAPGFDEPLFLPLEFRPPTNALSVGIRFGGRAKVTFSGVGTVGQSSLPALKADTTTTDRYYSDGSVLTDTRTRPDGTLLNDGFTTTWTYLGADQVVPDQRPAVTGANPYPAALPDTKAIEYHTYWTTNDGSTVAAGNDSTASWDIEIAHRLGGKKLVWGVVFGAGMSDIAAKADGTISANLVRLTHAYSLYGGTPPGAPFTGPMTVSVPKVDELGNPVLIAGGVQDSVIIDITPPLGQQPYYEDISNISATTVKGHWDVKGSFLTTRFGPYVQTTLWNRLGFRGSAGVTFTLVGAKMRYSEEATLIGFVDKISQADETVFENSTKIGYFASGDLEFMLTKRTGLFLGCIYEGYSGTTTISSFSGVTGAPNRTATVDTSGGLSIRFGMTARF